MDFLSGLDAYRRPKQGFSEKTLLGAAVSAAGIALMALLLIVELAVYATPVTTQRMAVDTGRNQHLHVGLNVTFHRAPCDVVTLDATDSSGKHEVNVEGTIHKARLDRLGRRLPAAVLKEDKTKHDQRVADQRAETAAMIAGAQAAAARAAEREAARAAARLARATQRTAAAAERAVARGRASPPPADALPDVAVAVAAAARDAAAEEATIVGAEAAQEVAIQAREDEEDAATAAADGSTSSARTFERIFNSGAAVAATELTASLDAGEGCLVWGSLTVARVAGNFHVTFHGLGYSALMQGYANRAMDLSHTVHGLHFGPHFPGLVSPLTGQERLLPLGEAGTWKYFLKVVPTEYLPQSGTAMDSNQYSVSEFYSAARPGDPQLPAVYFIYDLWPIKVRIITKRPPLVHFLTRTCAVLGGVYAVTGLLDRWAHRWLRGPKGVGLPGTTPPPKNTGR